MKVWMREGVWKLHITSKQMCTTIHHYALKTRSHKHNGLRRNTFSLLISTGDLSRRKKKTSLEFLCQVQHIAAAADCCKNVRGYIQEVGMYFFVIKETWAGCVTLSVNLPGILWHGWDCSSTLKLEERVERRCYYAAIDCWNRFT